MFYPISSVKACTDLCLSISNLVAIDIWSETCSIHTKRVMRYVASGVSQFIVNRCCNVLTLSDVGSDVRDVGLFNYGDRD